MKVTRHRKALGAIPGWRLSCGLLLPTISSSTCQSYPDEDAREIEPVVTLIAALPELLAAPGHAKLTVELRHPAVPDSARRAWEVTVIE